MDLLPNELRYLRRQVVRLNRLVALSHLEGPVTERDDKKWRVRLELAVDPDGNKILSPWVRVQSQSAGAYKDSPALPAIGDKMRLFSPSGIVGASSYAIANAFDEETTRPSNQDKDEVAREYDKTRLSQTKVKLTAKTEKTVVTQEKEKITHATEKATITQEKEKITHATENATVEQTKDAVSVKSQKTFDVETEKATIKGRTTEIHGDSIAHIKFVVGGQHFNIHPMAIVPAGAGA